MQIELIFNLIIMLLLIIILYFMWKITNLLQKNETGLSIKKKIELHEVTDQGIKKGDIIPEFTIIDPVNYKETVIHSNTLQSGFLLFTAVGCGECQTLLEDLSIYNLRNINENIVVLSFMPPEANVIPDKDRKKHFSAIEELPEITHYISSVDTLDQLKFNQFPLIMAIDYEGRSLGTYHGNIDVLRDLVTWNKM
ncbi:hypothetical protein ACK2WG_02210 [Bacillus spizizenii]|uniref:hypothetical protein n=1 Tax=Bacillus spizizenii TaxID=96241 RepID=UPI003833F3D5|nr:hypothetical protein [Bacillus subtilis]